MPALQPPDMQIGAPAPGYTTQSTNPAGPALAFGFNPAPPVLVQQSTGATSAAAPASVTRNFTASTKGTDLIALIVAALSGAATFSTPAGWTAVAGASGSNPGNTIGCAVFVNLNNPGGITSVTSNLTGVNGAAIAIYEWANVYGLDPTYASAFLSNSSAAPAATSYTPVIGPVVLVGAEFDLTGQSYTPANVGAGWAAGSVSTSTAGATNVIIRPFSTITSPLPQSPYQLAGTLAGALACGSIAFSLQAGAVGAFSQAQPQADGVGAGVWAWGPLGNTKPGGAGSGQ